jgi:hypothetical protein
MDGLPTSRCRALPVGRICVVAHRPDIRRRRSCVVKADKLCASDRRLSGDRLSVRGAKPVNSSHGLTGPSGFLTFDVEL